MKLDCLKIEESESEKSLLQNVSISDDIKQFTDLMIRNASQISNIIKGDYYDFYEERLRNKFIALIKKHLKLEYTDDELEDKKIRFYDIKRRSLKSFINFKDNNSYDECKLIRYGDK